MTVSSSAPRIGGWLLLPLAWLLVTLLTSGLVMAVYLSALFHPDVRLAMMNDPRAFMLQWGLSLLTSAAVWFYSLLVAWMFFKRSRRLPRHYIIWLLITVVLAVKSFAFSPVSDSHAIRTLLIALAAAATLAPYFRRSERVKTTFIAE